MKKFLATTAIALVVANGAFAESHVNADGTPTDGAMSTDTTTAPADGTMTTDSTTDGTPTMDSSTDGAASTDTSTDATADTATDGTMGDTTATEMSDPTASTDSASTTMESAGSSDVAMAPTMTVDGYDTLMNADVTAEMLTGTDVYGPNDEEVGEIGDLVIGDDGTVSDVIVDVGGFLGLGEKPVSIAYDSVQIMKQTDGDDMRAYVAMTEDQLKELPKYEAEPAADATTDMPAADAPAADAPATDVPAADAPATDAPAADADAPATDEPAADAPATDAPAANN